MLVNVYLGNWNVPIWGSTLYLESWWNVLNQKTMIEIPLDDRWCILCFFFFGENKILAHEKMYKEDWRVCKVVLGAPAIIFMLFWSDIQKPLLSSCHTETEKHIRSTTDISICISRFNAWLNRNLLDVCTGMSMVLSRWIKTCIYVGWFHRWALCEMNRLTY